MGVIPRKILLIEPKYKNKYPPIGLMKIATYHRMLGDDVTFFKGDVNDLVLDNLVESIIDELKQKGIRIQHLSDLALIRQYLKTPRIALIQSLVEIENFDSDQLLEVINRFSSIYRKKEFKNYPKWDRIYITTLFTFYWKVTVSAIHAAKNLTNNLEDIFIGGVLASLLKKELEIETGIKPVEGLLDKAGILDPNLELAKHIIVDDLPLDYSILEEIDYKYPTGSAYFTFMTKGCTRKCKFCSVPILEPTYKPKVPTIDKFLKIKDKFGEQQNLLLMDNNVLASPNFPEIIEEIKQMGFYIGATFIEPNQLEIAINCIKSNFNELAYTIKAQNILIDFQRRLRGAIKAKYLSILENYSINSLYISDKSTILGCYDEIRDIYERFRPKIPRARYVDFNQGTDARYVTDELMKLMSEIPIRPLRIAFDYWGMKDQYEKAVRLAAKYGIKELSNYILYNFNDTPEELYKRLEINVSLNKELGMKIYSFPMKYIPLFGEEAKSRDHIGKNWNRKYIRAVQSILNVTKGIVAPGSDFFELAFGKTLDDFKLIIEMPEEYIIYRNYFENIGLTQEWRKEYLSLNPEELSELRGLTHTNNFKEIDLNYVSAKISHILQHYLIKKNVENLKDYKRLKNQFDKLIKKETFIELTLTYDFEQDIIPNNSKRKDTLLRQGI